MNRLLVTTLVLALGVLQAASVALAQPNFQTAEEALNAGRGFIRDGKLADCRGPLEAALRLATTDALRLEVNRTLLIPYRELQEIEPMQRSAEYIIAHSIEQPAERSLTRQSLLTFINRRGQMDAAVKGYEERLKKAPEDSTVLYLLAEAYATYKRDPARSAEVGERLAAVWQKLGRKPDLTSQVHLAEQYVKAGKLKEGAELYEQVAPADANREAWHYKAAAEAWLKAEDKTRALAAAARSDKAPPEKRTELLAYFWHRGLADVYLQAGEPKKAIPHYEQALTKTKLESYLADCRKKLADARAAAEK